MTIVGPLEVLGDEKIDYGGLGKLMLIHARSGKVRLGQEFHQQKFG